MLKNSENQYNFWSVGQGLFVTMKFDDINIVYDCGSVQKKLVERQVERYVESLLPERNIDVLFISHFHEDHINGIFKLLECINKVDYVFIPYIPLLNRIYIIENLLKNINHLRDNHVIRLAEFIFDPVSCIKENFKNKIGREVVVVLGGNRKKDDEGRDNISERRGLNIDRRAFFDEESSEVRLVNRVEVFDASKKLYNSNYPIFISGAENGRQIELIKIKCFNYIGVDDLSKIEEALYWFKNEIFKVTQGVKGKEIVERLLEKRKRIKSLHRDLNIKVSELKDFNQTSLCLLVCDDTKILKKKVKIQSFEKCSKCSKLCGQKMESIIFYNKELHITLLTGDINLKNEKIRNKLLCHFNLNNSGFQNSSLGNKIDLFVTPHHGSKYNWSSEMLKCCDDLCIFLFPITCRHYARFGVFPSSDVMSELKKKYFIFSLI